MSLSVRSLPTSNEVLGLYPDGVENSETFFEKLFSSKVHAVFIPKRSVYLAAVSAGSYGVSVFRLGGVKYSHLPNTMETENNYWFRGLEKDLASIAFSYL